MPADARQLGLEALRAGRFADAAKHLSGFIGSAPNDGEARLAFALALSGRGDHDKALIHLDKLLTKTPNSAALHYHRGQILERAKRMDQARREYRRVLELDPNHAKSKAKLQATPPPSNPGFEVIEDEPQFEVVEEEIEIAESVDEDMAHEKLSLFDDGDVIASEEMEEIWADDQPAMDWAVVAKYVVMLLAVVGASVFGFWMFATNLAVIFCVGIAIGALMLGVADHLYSRKIRGAIFWILHLGGLILLIGTAVGVMIAYRMHIADDPNKEGVPSYLPSQDMVRPRNRRINIPKAMLPVKLDWRRQFASSNGPDTESDVS